ncbi:Beta-myrcene/(E)-beta-ocimene synthase 2 [Citrus sinensis]|uniref:Beta-myrcene/(E)-beta-ocimene synthase 2 n=1 Tax=Citrus sinensis TaxID=2711 RepID=A0ACB8ISN7_CITSI|nr:Beta-myrcene/(E)-beta-ocimene synthase 2 [Citrus sinensis]
MHRLETRWLTDVYESGPNTKSFLLELAKLGFNIVHAARQEDRKYVSSGRQSGNSNGNQFGGGNFNQTMNPSDKIKGKNPANEEELKEKSYCWFRFKKNFVPNPMTNRRSAYVVENEGHMSLRMKGGESYARQLEKLKEQVSAMLQQDNKVVDLDPLHQLELIDNLHRLGVSYHFEDEIKRTLDRIHNKNTNKSLYATALKFRILRQYGYNTPVKETFSRFMDEKGSFKLSSHSDECKGMLALYEAAYLLVEEESSIFRDAIRFTTAYLKEWVAKHDIDKNDDEYLCTLVKHALELPLHWRMRRLEARWFIDVYQSGPDMNPILLELAKLDNNIVQANTPRGSQICVKVRIKIYNLIGFLLIKYGLAFYNIIKSIYIVEKFIYSLLTVLWWKKTGLGEKLNFARDRVVENFFWTVGDIFEPQFGYCRRMSAMVNCLLTSIDDVYDVYGTLDELELFTDAVERWDATATEQLPYYMKLCFHALYNSVNEMGFIALRDQEVGMIIPYLKKADELKRGDVPKSIQCYMHETGVSEDEAREHIRDLIAETWMKMNSARFGNPPYLPDVFIGMAMNLVRMSQCMYLYGDGHGVQENTKDRVLSLFIDPIP